MNSETFDADVIVIGAGPGGYYAAIRAAQLGAKVICVEKQFLGGTCLNVGCVPSKVLIGTVEALQRARSLAKMGVDLNGSPSLNLAATMARKDRIVGVQRGGVGDLFKKNGVRHVAGVAKFVDPHAIEVDGQKISGRAFIVATGSRTIRLDVPGLVGGRDEGAWTSDDAVDLPHVPMRTLILGGGAVGCEFAYVLNGMGSKVTLVEMMDRLAPMPGIDADLGIELGKSLSRQGIDVRTGSSVERCERIGDSWRVFLKGGATVEVDVVLLGVGRRANYDGMGLEEIGVRFHARGVEVDGTMRTDLPHIFAIGDVTGRIQLAHVAEHEGLVTAHNAVTGGDKKADYRAVPNCVYTVPEVASVGLTEGQAMEKGFDVKVGRFNFRPLARAMASGEQDGFVKVVVDSKYGEVLGVHMIGPHVSDMIHEGVAAIKLEATVESMNETVHAHPTMSEAIAEAFEDAHGQAIHK